MYEDVSDGKSSRPWPGRPGHGRELSALRAVGGDVEIFRTKFLGGDRDEKIDFRRITSRAS